MAKRLTQLKFKGEGLKKPADCFGGSLLKDNNAKKPRPLESKFPVHLVLRSVQGGMRLPKTICEVNRAVERICRKHGVKKFEYANVGNHLHLLIKIPSRPSWSPFIRELTGRIAQIVQGLKGKQKGLPKFWKHRPYTRIVRGWQKAFRIAREYVELNQLEAEGMINRKETKTLKSLKEIWQDG